MNFILIFAVALALSCIVDVNSEGCFDQNEACHSTDYQSYVDCVRKRHKRSTDCDNSCNSGNCINTCNSCDCDSCNYNNCENNCNSCCSTCCSNYIPCRTNHCCHRTCQAQCDNTKCRSTCRKNCFETVRTHSEPVYIPQPSSGASGQSSSVQNTSIINNSRHNVTTIIHLNNVINNTNIIDVPININNTNDQNITLYTADDTVAGHQKEQCCTVIGPRQCVSYPTPKCFHYRSKQCGAYCTANIVHKEEKQVCESYYPGAPVNCRQQIYYIPQPTPKCVYQSTWPYVSCGIQTSQVGCEGCYSHYVDQTSTNYLQCSSQCYDQGYQAGSFYRQGPVYKPMYYHAPCNGYYGCAQPYNVGYDYAASNAQAFVQYQQGYSPYQQGFIPEQQGYGSYVPVGPYPINFVQPPEQVIPLNSTLENPLLRNSTKISESQILSDKFPVDFQMGDDPNPPAHAFVRIRNSEKYKRDEAKANQEITTVESKNGSTILTS